MEEEEEEEEEEEDKSFYGMRQAMWTIPTRSPRYIELFFMQSNPIPK